MFCVQADRDTQYWKACAVGSPKNAMLLSGSSEKKGGMSKKGMYPDAND